MGKLKNPKNLGKAVKSAGLMVKNARKTLQTLKKKAGKSKGKKRAAAKKFVDKQEAVVKKARRTLDILMKKKLKSRREKKQKIIKEVFAKKRKAAAQRKIAKLRAKK